MKNTLKYVVTKPLLDLFISGDYSDKPWGEFSKLAWPGVKPDATRRCESYCLRQARKLNVDSEVLGSAIEIVTDREIRKALIKESNTHQTWSVTTKSEERIPNYSLHAIIKRHTPVNQARQVIDELVELARTKMPKVGPLPVNNSDVVIGFCAFDLHIGKLAWGKECGADYNIETAIKYFLQGVEVAYEEARHKKASRIFFPLGNDLIHVDGKNNQTFAGTPQDVDTRFQKIYTETRKACVLAINRLAEVAPVDVIIVPGNHDATVMFTLGDALELFYSNNLRVTVDNTPKSRKYYEFGQNLILFTHGSEESGKVRLGEICAAEMPEAWGRTRFHSALIGHLHHEILKDTLGFNVRVVASLSPPDAYHKDKGFINNIQRSEILIYDNEKGLIGNRYANV